jgi:hypothetical protein
MRLYASLAFQLSNVVTVANAILSRATGGAWLNYENS